LLIFNSYEYKELNFNEIDKYHRSYIRCLNNEKIAVNPNLKTAHIRNIMNIINFMKKSNVSGKENSKPDLSLFVLIIFFDLQLNAPSIK